MHHIFPATTYAMEVFFTYMSGQSSGGTGDIKAFHRTALNYLLQEIPCGFYVVGDSACALSPSSLVPFTGAD